MKKIILILTLFLVLGTAYAVVNNGDKGAKVFPNNTYQAIVFNKNETSNASAGTIDMNLYIRSSYGGGKPTFIGTKRNSEVGSFFTNASGGGWGYKNYGFYYTSCGQRCASGYVNNDSSRRTDERWIFVPAKGTYAFQMQIQRQSFQGSENFKLYVDLNKDGDYNDSGEYLCRSTDTGTDDSYCSIDGSTCYGKWKGCSTQTDGGGDRIRRTFPAGGYYKFKMESDNGTGMNVGIGNFRLYVY